MDNWLRNNNIIRIVAIVVGILLWVIVRLDVQNSSPSQSMTVSQRHTDVAIQIEGLDEERFILRSIEPEKVSLTVIGTTNALRRLRDNYKVVLDLSDALPGETLMPLKAVNFPNNVEVVLDPPNITVTLDEIVQKEMPVSLEVSGTPQPGYIAGEPVLEPSRVHVTVPNSRADEVASVVGTMDIEGASNNVKKQVKLAALNADGQALDLEISPAVIEVEVPVTLPFKQIPLQVKLEGEPPPGYAVDGFEQSALEVTIYAPQAILDNLDFYDGLSIDLSGLKETRTFNFDIPEKSGVQKVEPSSVSVEVRVVPSVTETLEDVPLTMSGMDEAYEYVILPPEDAEGQEASAIGYHMDVPVEASPNMIDGLEARDVQATVDVRNVPPGSYELMISYSLPANVKLAPDALRSVRMEVKGKGTPVDAEPGTTPEEQPGEDSGGVEAGSGSNEEVTGRVPDSVSEAEPNAIQDHSQKTVTRGEGIASNTT